MPKRGTAVIVLLLSTAAAGGCRDRSASTFTAPIGAGPEARLEAPGSARGRASIATRGRYVAVAWITSDDKNAGLYVASSDDAGATFHRPVKIETGGPPTIEPTEPARIFFVSYDVPPVLVVEWLARSSPFDVTRYAESRDGGKRFVADPPGKTRQVSLNDSWTPSPDDLGADLDAARPQSVLDNDHTLVVVWEGATGAGAPIAMRRVVQSPRGGLQRLALPPVTTEPTAANPAIERIPGGVIVAWTQEDGGARSLRLRRIGLDDMCLDKRPGASAHTPTMTYQPWSEARGDGNANR